MEYAHYSDRWDAIVVMRVDGTEEFHPCGSVNSNDALREVWDALQKTEQGWYERYPYLVRKHAQ